MPYWNKDSILELQSIITSQEEKYPQTENTIQEFVSLYIVQDELNNTSLGISNSKEFPKSKQISSLPSNVI
jgi:hypothetical protein